MSAAKKHDVKSLRFMTLEDISEATRYHRKTLERFIREGKLKTVKLNGKRLVLVSEFENFIRSSLEDGELEF